MVDRCGPFETLAGAGTSFSLGTFTLSPAEATVRPGEPITYTLTWTVPAPLNWHDLTNLQLQFRDNQGVALRVRWDEQSDAFRLVDIATGEVGLGSQSPAGALHLASTSSTGSGPTGPSVTLRITLSFDPALAGRTFTVETSAAGDNGQTQGFEPAGRLTVAQDGKKDDEPNVRPLTPEQRQQRQRTDTSSLDDTHTEGHVLSVSCDSDPRTVTIANMDGHVEVRLLGEARKACSSIKIGNYLEADGEKQHELLFEAYEVNVEP